MNWSDLLVEQIAERVFEKVQGHLSHSDRIFANKLTFDEQEAADIIGVPRYVLKGCRERGEIKPRKIGKRWHYSREQLCEFASQKGGEA